MEARAHQGVVVLGGNPIGDLLRVEGVAEIPEDTAVVVVPWLLAEGSAEAVTAVRETRAGVGVIAWVGSGASEELEAALRDGVDDVAVSEAHLHQRIAWMLRFREVSHREARERDDADRRTGLVTELAAKPDLQDVLHLTVLRLAELFAVDTVAVVLGQASEEVVSLVKARGEGTLENLVLRLADHPQLRRLLAAPAPKTLPAEAAAALLYGGAATGDVLPHTISVLQPLVGQGVVLGALLLCGDEQRGSGEAERLFAIGHHLAAPLSVALGSAIAQEQLLDAQRELLHRQEMADARLANLQTFSDIFERSFDGILITDDDGVIRYANAAAGAILQRRPVELQGLSFLQFLNPRSHVLAERAYRGDPVGDAYGYVDLLVLDGLDADTVISAAVRPLGDGEGVLVSFRDVTELREIENELRQTKDFLENLIQSSVDAIVAADVDGMVILFNRAAEEILGYSTREVVGKINIKQLYPPGEYEDVMRRLRSDGFGGRGRLEVVRKDIIAKSSERVPISMTAAVIYEENGESAVVGVFTDLRERIKMEAKLSLVQQKLRMSERQAVAIELAGTAAHELNQPLTSILGYAEILKRQEMADDMTQKAIAVIGREVERMAAIVRRIGEITAYEPQQYVGGSQILNLERNNSLPSGGLPSGPPPFARRREDPGKA